MSLFVQIVIFIPLLLAKPSLQECPLKPEVVQSTSYSQRLWPASNVLKLGEDYFPNDTTRPNFWVANFESNKSSQEFTLTTEHQGFTLRLDACSRMITGCQIKNTGNGRHGWATKGFKVSGAKNENGPWQTLVEDDLVNTSGTESASLLNFTFDNPVQIKFLKFEVVSFWRNGAALQYFAAVPLSTDCNLTPWTDWTLCCNDKRSKTRTQIRDGQCKTVTEVEDCTGDNCPGSSATRTTGLDPLLALLICLFLVCCRGCNNSCTLQGENKQSL